MLPEPQPMSVSRDVCSLVTLEVETCIRQPTSIGTVTDCSPEFDSPACAHSVSPGWNVVRPPPGGSAAEMTKVSPVPDTGWRWNWSTNSCIDALLNSNLRVTGPEEMTSP